MRTCLQLFQAEVNVLEAPAVRSRLANSPYGIIWLTLTVWCAETRPIVEVKENCEPCIVKPQFTMSGNPWKPGKASRHSTNNWSEIARVTFCSLFLTAFLHIPLSRISSMVYSKPGDILVGFSGPDQAYFPSPKAPGINSVDQNRLVQQQTFQPTSVPHYAFIKYSTYRYSLKTFLVVGISSKVVFDQEQRQVVHTCEWHPSNGSQPNEVHSDPEDFIVANASMLYIEFDENGMTYVPAIVNCTFSEDVGADGSGGLLVIKVSLTYHRYEKNVPAIVLDEQKGDAKLFINPPEKKPHKYAYCGPPMHTHVKADWIKAWMVYHNYLWDGDALFFFYNVGGLKDEDRHLFKDFLDAGILTIKDRAEHFDRLYPSWYYHQLLYINDCLQRARSLADYVFFFDFDEFIQIPAPETIGSLLEKHKELPWLTVGNIPADIGHCTPPATSSRQYPVERMHWHNKLPECMHDDEDCWMCIAAIGRRKWVANTKYTILGGVHRAALPYEGGLNMNASEARVIHFHGVLSPKKIVCNSVVEEKDYGGLGHMERDDAISRVYAQAKLFRVKRKDIPASQR